MTEIYYAIGCILPIALISILVRRFVLRGMAIGFKRNLFAILIAWPIFIVIASFAVGEGGLASRFQNVPDLQVVIASGISALILIAILFIAAAVGGSLKETPDA